MSLVAPRGSDGASAPDRHRTWKVVHQPDLIGHDYHFDEFDVASGTAFGGERTLVGRTEVSRTAGRDGLTVTTRTTFEFWSLGRRRSVVTARVERACAAHR
jgi:hypothetical protein